MRQVMMALIVVMMAGMGLVQAQPGASCVIRFESDSSTLPLTPDMINALASSSGVLKAALGEHHEALREYDVATRNVIRVTFEVMHDDLDLIVGRLSVEMYDWVDDETKDVDLVNGLLSGVCTQLREMLEHTGREDREHLAQRLARAEEALVQAREKLARIQELEQELCTAAGRYELRREAVLSELEELRQTKQSLEMSLQALRARREALAQQIAEVGEQAEAEVEDDPVVAELEKVVSLREAELARMLKLADEGSVSRGEVMGLHEQVARARAELAQHRRAALHEAGAEWLDELNETLMDVSSELFGRAAELEAVEARLAEIEERNLLELMNRYEREVHLERQMAEHAVREALEEVQVLSHELRSYQMPRVTILGKPE